MVKRANGMKEIPTWLLAVLGILVALVLLLGGLLISERMTLASEIASEEKAKHEKVAISRIIALGNIMIQDQDPALEAYDTYYDLAQCVLEDPYREDSAEEKALWEKLTDLNAFSKEVSPAIVERNRQLARQIHETISCEPNQEQGSLD